MTAIPDPAAEPVLNPKLTLSAAGDAEKADSGTSSVACTRCHEPESYFVHKPSSECAGGYPCINPGAHHAYMPASPDFLLVAINVDGTPHELTEAETRALWGDR